MTADYGNVGIGKTNPIELLHVNGNTKIEGSLTSGQIISSSSITATSFIGTLSGNATTATNSKMNIQYHVVYNGSASFNITTKAAKCNLQMYIGGDKYLHYVLTNMVIGSNNSGDAAASYSINGVAYYIPYITRQGGGI